MRWSTTLKAETTFEGAENILTSTECGSNTPTDRPGLPIEHPRPWWLRLEADSEEAIVRIQADFRRAIEVVWPGVIAL